jgi:hypothetical protein
MHVHVGLDTYGKVKSVGGTSIVTKFFMVNGVPVYPLESFYFSAAEGQALDERPFLGLRLPVTGIPLARVDRASVLIAYLRGLCGVLVVVGFIGSIFMIVPLLMGPQGMAVDPVKTLQGMLCVLGVGIVVGALTYAIPLASRRERLIRRHCGELLGFCADPARTHADLAAQMFQEQLSGASSADMSEAALSRLNCLLQLIKARCRIAGGQHVREMEQTTDELLARLSHRDGKH